jgi:hypothetical protein
MTKGNAILAMKKGKKVTHYYFSREEWATMKNGQIVLEDDVKCSPDEFWRWRQGPDWEIDWEIWKP